MATWTDVTAVAAELESAPAGLQSFALAVANLRCPADVWGDELELARALMAAHVATLALRRGVGGAVASRAAGPVSESYAVPAGASMSTTAYGQLFLDLARGLDGARLPIIGGVP